MTYDETLEGLDTATTKIKTRSFPNSVSVYHWSGMLRNLLEGMIGVIKKLSHQSCSPRNVITGKKTVHIASTRACSHLVVLGCGCKRRVSERREELDMAASPF